MMKIDLHVHTTERSACSNSSEDEQIRAAIDAELDAIAISDHDLLVTNQRLGELNLQYMPFKIYGGIEVSVWDVHLSTFEHFLVLGVQDSLLETNSWTYPELWEYVREQQGFLAVAHLYRFRETSRLDLRQFPPDALEVASNNISPALHRRILALANDLGIPVLSNSDAHHVNAIGRYYNELFDTPTTNIELIDMLRNGDFRPVWPKEYSSLAYS